MRYSHLRADGRASFFYPAGAHRAVAVTGSFDGWRPAGRALAPAPGGWALDDVPLPPGDAEYKFVVDGRWERDPVNLTRAPNGDNSLLPRAERGTCYHLTFHAPSLGEARGYVAYLPPGYHTDEARRFPAIYLLHGALDWERTWLEKGALAGAMDRLLSQGAAREALVVMPFEGGGLHRGDARVADYLARDLVGHVDHAFRTVAAPGGRALDGLSTGGFTSLVLGARRPDTFGSVGTMSGSHDARSFEAVRACAAAMRAAGQRYVVSGGTDEPHLADGRALAAELVRHGLEARWIEASGGHDWPLWRALIEPHVRFHAAAFAG